MVLEIFRRGQELCEMVITILDTETTDNCVRSFKGLPEQVMTWALHQGATRDDVNEIYENLFEDDATYAIFIPSDGQGVRTSNKSPKVDKVENNVVFVNFKKAS